MISLKDRLDAQLIFFGTDDVRRKVAFALQLKDKGITAAEVDEWIGNDQYDLGLRVALATYHGADAATGNIPDRTKQQLLRELLSADLSELAGFHLLALNAVFHMFGKLSLLRLQKTLPTQYEELAKRMTAAFPESEDAIAAIHADYQARFDAMHKRR